MWSKHRNHANNTPGEVTSHNQWSRYDRHFFSARLKLNSTKRTRTRTRHGPARTRTDFFCGETPLSPCWSGRVRVVEFSFKRADSKTGSWISMLKKSDFHKRYYSGVINHVQGIIGVRRISQWGTGYNPTINLHSNKHSLHAAYTM